ncbi:peroxynitrite isomerase Rv2717c [Aristolochia californica]|uniref:peroxynitrite isomerase Rv2717c n=1 Tax=Aristolochia californica TaxID=171875 RepID=UPI0035DC90B5
MEGGGGGGGGGGGSRDGDGSGVTLPPSMHPAIVPLSYLLGTWRGQGEGCFPTINHFKYGEEITFSHSGKPVIAYTSKTWKSASGEPMHAESGYWRPKNDGSIEVVVAQSTGLVEVQKGTFDAEHRVVKLQSELVGNASKVKEISRVFEMVNGELSYVVQMATNLNHLQPHLKALLRKL